MPNGGVGSDALCEAVLGFTLPKGAVRLSPKWDNPTLSEEQVNYAARDALAGLLIHQEIIKLPDPTIWLKADGGLHKGRNVEVFPTTGSVAVLARRVATGAIVSETGVWTNPHNQKKVNLTPSRVLVRIDSTDAPEFKLKQYCGKPNDPTRDFMVFQDLISTGD